VTFDLHSARFQFTARDRIQFPPHQAGNVLRGALGTAFRKIVCVPECPGRAGAGVRECLLQASCAYAQIFEPAAIASGPSGQADRPRPFVIRARHLNGRIVHPGESFCFDLHLFHAVGPPLEHFRGAFQSMAADGFGLDRGKAELANLEVAPVSIALDPPQSAASRVRVRFRTPTELKSGSEIVSRPEFAVLFARARDRVAALRALYGEGPLEIDFRGMGSRSGAVQLIRSDVQYIDTMRRSSRTGQRHGIGGFVGIAEYQGDLREFLPLLTAAQWTGVGRHCSWGNGEIGLEYA